MKELIEQFSKTPTVPTDEVTLYHLTKTRYLPGIFGNGLVPGINYDRDFYGISQEVIDRYVPAELTRRGVSRRTVVYCYFTPSEAYDSANIKNAILMVKTTPSRVFVSDMAMVPLSQVWNVCLLEPYSKLLNLLSEKGWAPKQVESLAKLFEVHFLDENFVNQIIETNNQTEDATLQDQLLSIIKEGHINIATKGRRESLAYWKNVVSLDHFISDFTYNPRVEGWISSGHPRRRIFHPEALVIGSVDPQNIQFLGRGNRKKFH